MQAYGAGDGKAFEILYGRYRLRLYRFLQRMLRSSEADEVFQEVWLAIVKGRARYVPTARFATFLFSIAHNCAAEKLRSRGRSLIADTPLDEADEPAADHGSEPLNITLNAELGKALENALALLPLPQREAFLMQAEGELSLDEIAEVSGVARETVKSRLRYANRRLRHSLEMWK